MQTPLHLLLFGAIALAASACAATEPPTTAPSVTPDTTTDQSDPAPQHAGTPADWPPRRRLGSKEPSSASPPPMPPSK